MKTTPPSLAIYLTLFATAIGIGSLCAEPIIIDNFSATMPAISASTQLDGEHILGGEADFTFGLSLEGSFAISGGNGELSDVMDPGGSGYFRIVYDGEDNNSSVRSHDLGDIDFTDGGANDRFAIDLPTVTGEFSLSFTVSTGSDDRSYDTFTVNSPGVVEILFTDLIDIGMGADLESVTAIEIRFNALEEGDSFVIDSFMARDANTPPEDDPVAAETPDLTGPTLQILNTKKLKKPKTRHKISGTAFDDGTVVKVEVKGKKAPYKSAKLLSSGNWTFKTPKLTAKKNSFSIRAYDAAGNLSPTIKVKARGK